MHLAVDSIADVEGLVARFLPLRMASGLSPCSSRWPWPRPAGWRR
jgi:hypothetical protein